MRLLTWLDVEREIRKVSNNKLNLPPEIERIDCFYDAIEIGISNKTDRGNINKYLTDWFGDWYDSKNSLIRLDLDDATIPVEILYDNNTHRNNVNISPLWKNISYLRNNDSKNISYIPSTPQDKHGPQLVAFYSFKGGVGRSTHLAAYLFALLAQAKKINRPVTAVVIDADLEAPGLTYWSRKEKLRPDISFANFLEVYHYPPIEREAALSSLIKKISEYCKYQEKSKYYFLPAFINDRELLDMPIQPENLARSSSEPWQVGEALYKLGQLLKADFVFVDLRAGLSEISSPILLDPRFERFIFTTLTEQSISGTSLVLEEISKLSPTLEHLDSNKLFDPTVVLTMLTPELKSNEVYENAMTRLQESYNATNSTDEYIPRLQFEETYFSQELLYIKDWQDGQYKISMSPSIMKVASEWAQTAWTPKGGKKEPNKTTYDMDSVKRLKDTCEAYQYAEKGVKDELLITDALQNLAIKFTEQLPRIISIGAKGAGKTFNFLQLARIKFWENFLALINPIDSIDKQLSGKAIMYPFLVPNNLGDEARKLVDAARDEVDKVVNLSTGNNKKNIFHARGLSDLIIKDRLKNKTDWSEFDWTLFWIENLAKSVNYQLPRVSDGDPASIFRSSLQSFNYFLESQKLRFVYLIDGLEEIFEDIANKNSQQIALEALLKLPSRINEEIRKPNFGIIVFLRRDYLRYAIKQNAGQLEDRYKPFELNWDYESFLRLVVWLCQRAAIIDKKIQPSSLGREDLANLLEKLWGKKLGKANSKEAYSFSWVFAALTDFKGRLQARDVVRFLYYAAKKTIDDPNLVAFSVWNKERLLPPSAVRHALRPCSTDKVMEANTEYPEFKDWVEEINNLNKEKRVVPFSVDQLPIESRRLEFLKDIGVIYEDRDKDGVLKFYIPEIFRYGLNFELDSTIKPRVLALKRKSMGKGLV
ncbi:ParA family protein [Heliobacillus mobilis]|uniref:ParA family protein n=1 Tax=Heliobacterium mobile TaxID=28064 RepID=A0A6I3SQG3_HELMO|nr:ParA family protein [Heliobacterium mobile]MTV50956.1 ParA family protein [Heliobacterium mobile]